MTQESWPYQGRRGHGWFGHGTAPHADDPPPPPAFGRENPPAPADIAARATYVGYGALGPMDRPLARSWESRLENGALGHLKTVIAAHPASRHLGDEAYRWHILGHRLGPEETFQLRRRRPDARRPHARRPRPGLGRAGRSGALSGPHGHRQRARGEGRGAGGFTSAWQRSILGKPSYKP